MLQGVGVRLHKGSVCHVHSFHDGLDGERCTVLSFDGAKKEWLVRIQGGDFRGKELSIAESSLRLRLLPATLSAFEAEALFRHPVRGYAGFVRPWPC